tara:strand:+ start:126 stop:425 length:300 start_codon:yes stop_codon:yes gene_type:complete
MTQAEKINEITSTIQWLLDKGDFEDWETAYNNGMNSINILEEAINFTGSSLELPSKEEIISEGEKQIVDWLDGNTDLEKKHYRVAFRRSFEYVLRRLKD